MLWAALCLLLLQTAAGQNPICQFYTDATEEGFILMNLVGIAQYFPNSTVDEIEGLLVDAKALGDKCCSAAQTLDCLDDLTDVFLRSLCDAKELTERNDLMPCCEKVDADRITCFREHKILPREVEPLSADNCTLFKEDGEAYQKSYIFSVAKQNPMTPPQEILSIAEGYNGLMKSCCDRNDTQTCLDTKKPIFDAYATKRSTELRVSCILQEKYEDTMKEKKIVEYSQRFPQFSAAEMHPLVERIVSTNVPCCQGDMIGCMKSRKELIDVICNNEDMTSRSPGLAGCCKIDVVRRSGCISNISPEPKPDDLSEEYDLLGDIQAVCESFNASAERAVDDVLAEQARRHPEASYGILIRYARTAEAALTKCCPTEDYAECVNATMSGVDLEKDLTDAIAKFNVTGQSMVALGDIAFEERVFFNYARKMPQASFDQLHQLADKVTNTYKECLEDGKNFLVCEDQLTDIIDEACHDYNTANINSHLDNCCSQSYETRLNCIMSMKPDTDFESPVANTTLFPMGPVLCSDKAEELLEPHQRLLYGLAQYRPDITDEEYCDIWILFDTTRSICCKKEHQEACFNDGAPELIKLAVELFKGK